MATQIAPNGNMASVTDPNFIHFAEEEKGLLLANMPGYPSYLPSLQLSPSGRLCFWNMPAKIFKSVADDTAKKGTGNYLVAFDNVKNWNDPYQPIGSDSIDTNGRQNGIPFWMEAGTVVPVAASDAQNLLNIYKSWWNNYNGKNPPFMNAPFPNWKPGYPVTLNVAPNAWSNIYNPPQARTSNASWVIENWQYWINQFLQTPYCVLTKADQYGQAWPDEFVKRIADGNLNADFLNNCNFYIIPTGKPDFWDNVGLYGPIVGAGIISIASMGAATPGLVAAIGALTTLAKGQLSATMKQVAAAVSATSVNKTVNTGNLQTVVNSGGQSIYDQTLGSMTSNQKLFLFIAAIVVAILLTFITIKK